MRLWHVLALVAVFAMVFALIRTLGIVLGGFLVLIGLEQVVYLWLEGWQQRRYPGWRKGSAVLLLISTGILFLMWLGCVGLLIVLP